MEIQSKGEFDARGARRRTHGDPIALEIESTARERLKNNDGATEREREREKK